MTVIAVANQKGGVGKTTLAYGLAGVAAENGHRAAVVDVDTQGSTDFLATRAGDDLPFDVEAVTDLSKLTMLRQIPYDRVFVDTPGNLDDTKAWRTILANVDFVLVPTEAAPLSVEPLITTVRKHIDPSGVAYRVVLNKVDPRSLPDAHDAAKMYAEADLLCTRTYLRSYKAHVDAGWRGRAPSQYAKDIYSQNAANDMRKLYRELEATLSELQTAGVAS
jgi:chromosome partitioning protein